MILICGVKDLDVRELAVAVGEGPGTPPFGLGCIFFIKFLMVRWTVARCAIALITVRPGGRRSSGGRPMVALLRLEGQIIGGKVVGAVALSKVPPQVTGLVHPFAFVFII